MRRNLTFDMLCRAAMRKRAATVLTPEAEQAAVQGGMTPPGAPMGGGMPPQGMPMDPAAGGMPPQGAPQGMTQGGGQLPPEILQDQQFIAWMAQQGAQFDPTSGQFMDPSGQPIPPEVVMQAYQAYMQEMQGMMQQGAAGDPSMAQGMPQQAGAPPQGAAAGGQIPPEIMQDQGFIQFLTQAVGLQMDPSGSSFISPDGQPVPPDMIIQAYQAYMQQMQAQGGQGMPPTGAEGGMPPAGPEGGAPDAGGMPPAGPEGTPEGGQMQLPPEVMEQIQSAVDASLQGFTAELDKKIEAMIDKLETVKMAIESMRDTDDKRTANDIQFTKQLQDELAEELNPTTKTATAEPEAATAEEPKAVTPADVFAMLMGGNK